MLFFKLGLKIFIVVLILLIYNWSNEFKKFVLFIKVLICNGVKEEREELIKNYNEYDVILIIYNLLRRDLEYYIMEFNYCILDEV